MSMRMAEPNQGRVSLAGAGPGDPSLATLRCVQRLGEADVVLYDALVDPALLEYAPQAEKLFVGKRAGKPSARQARINALLVEHAQAGRKVVRLKGGDPYLFGRGSEEAEVLAQAGVDFEIVPGVPSPLAATSYAGISLTHRSLASSVAYLTATESPDKDRSAHDWSKLATATQSLVIFMGMRKLRSLMALLEEHGRDAECPVAVVHAASTPRQRTVVGTVRTIADLAEEAKLGLPSLIVVGEVVTLRESLRWFDKQPLLGKRFLALRAEAKNRALRTLLRERGAQTESFPLVQTRALEIENLVERCRACDVVAFTSAHAVRSVFDQLSAAGCDARVFGTAKLASVGGATEKTLHERGLFTDILPSEANGGALAHAILAETHKGRVFYPRATRAFPAFAAAISASPLELDEVSAYENVAPGEDELEKLREKIANAEAIFFTAPSMVERVLAADSDALRRKCIAIGESTAEALRAHGASPWVATFPSALGLVSAAERAFANE